MRDKKYHLYVDSHERSILLHSLVELKNQLIQQGRYTDPVDELIVKVTTARTKRIKIQLNRDMTEPLVLSIRVSGFSAFSGHLHNVS